MLSRRLTLWLVLAAGLVNIAAVCSIVASAAPHFSDFGRYFDIASSGGRPYVAFPVEYPFLTYLILRLAFFLTGSEFGFAVLLSVINLALFGICTHIFWNHFGRNACAYWACANLALAHVLMGKNDMYAIAAVVVALAASYKAQRIRSGLLIAIGVFCKLWPAPLALLFWPLQKKLKFSAAFLLGASLIGGVWTFIAGTGVFEAVTYRGAHGWEIESVAGSIARLWVHTPPVFENGSHRIGNFPTGLSLSLALCGIVLASASAWRGRRTGLISIGYIGAIGFLMITATLFSLQFIAWLVPGACLLCASESLLRLKQNQVCLVLLSVCVLLTPVLEILYVPLLQGSLIAETAYILRNIALIIAVGIAAYTLFSSRAVQLSAPRPAKERSIESFT